MPKAIPEGLHTVKSILGGSISNSVLALIMAGSLAGQSSVQIPVLASYNEAYVLTAEPAGSRTIARRFPLGVSAATIRNTMSDLEERGYLYHPHTSAGRLPTGRSPVRVFMGMADLARRGGGSVSRRTRLRRS